MPTRPPIERPFLGTWTIFAVATVLGLGSYWQFLGLSYELGGALQVAPDDRLGVNYYVYHYAAEAVLTGEDIYAVSPPGWGEFYTFLYPPVTVFLWVPGTILEPWTGYLVHTAGTGLAGGLFGLLMARYLESAEIAVGWIDIVAIAGFTVIGIHSTGTVDFGNINIILATGLIGGLLALEQSREWLAGGVFGAVALLKILPALIGVYLLWRRAWRAIGGAILVGGGGILASVVLFGPDTFKRFIEVLRERSETAAFVGGYPPDETYYVTIQRPLSHIIWEGELPAITLAPKAPSWVVILAAIGVLAVGLGYCYIDITDRVDQLIALQATLTAMVLVVPSLRWYLVFVFPSWIALLYVWDPGRPAQRQGFMLAVGVFLVGLIGWIGAGMPRHWSLAVGGGGLAIGLAYTWYGTAVGTLFFTGALTAAITVPPDELQALVDTGPDPLATITTSVVAIATPQLLGLLLMLGAGILYKWQTGVRAIVVWQGMKSVPQKLRSIYKTGQDYIESRARGDQ